MANLAPEFMHLVGLIRAEDLAIAWGYSGANNAFREFCVKLGVRHVPGRPGWYDPQHIRQRLDAAQGTGSFTSGASAEGLVAQRRARRGTA